MYLVHDTWGHCWQEALTEFEWEYAYTAQLDAPFHPDDLPNFDCASSHEALPTFACAFGVVDGRTQLDAAKLMEFAEVDLRSRIRIATSVMLAELLADFMEAKYARLRPATAMKTSSLIPPTSLKLDLSISDLRRQIYRIKRRYKRLAREPHVQQQLVRELADAGHPEKGLKEAVARAAELMWQAFGAKLSVKLDPVAMPDGRLKSSVFRRLLLELVAIVAQLEETLAGMAIDAAEPWRDPARCADLVSLCLAHFYERNRLRKFWKINQMIRNELPVALAQLKAAL